MPKSECRVCRSESKTLFDGVILGRHPTEYSHCDACGYLQTGDPVWLGEAYSDAIVAFDTGLLARNLAFARVVSALLLLTGKKHGPFLDYGGGYGTFTRMMRDAGFDFYHQDPHAPNLFAKGFAWDSSRGRPTACTALEVLEHLTDPIQGLRELAALNPDWIITSTELLRGEPRSDWWYLAPESGQHIGFFEPRTIRYIGKAIGYPHVLTNDRIQLMARKPVSRLAWHAALRLSRPMYVLPRLLRRSLTERDSQMLRERIREIDEHGDT